MREFHFRRKLDTLLKSGYFDWAMEKAWPASSWARLKDDDPSYDRLTA